MIQKHFEDKVCGYLGFDFSPSQQKAMDAFCTFFFGNKEDSLFILKGYAGTGKTSLVAAIVNTLQEFQYKVVLLAPTGRAAKVFSAYAAMPAFTIHKKIYRQKTVTDGEGDFDLGFNGGHNVLFLVDEASMISNAGEDSSFGSGCLLNDLVEFVYNGRNNRLVLIGDMAQLPPVGVTVSPALDGAYLESHYRMSVLEADMTDIMRQAEESGILYNATVIRNLIGSGEKILRLKTAAFPDVVRIGGVELLEEIDNCYGRYGEEETMVICRSNKRANRFNEGIRRMILYREDDFCSGDRIMIVKNNYFWGKDYEHIDFLANGDIATVVRAGRRTEIYGRHFVEAELSIDGYEEEVSALIMLDTLTTDSSSLSTEENRMFYLQIESDFADLPSRKKRFEKIRDNEYYNALQVKFAYAITCHKAQGGQWDVVFVDQGWLADDMLNDDYWRWLYTAVTRARKKLYLINFKDEFFEAKEGEERE